MDEEICYEANLETMSLTTTLAFPLVLARGMRKNPRSVDAILASVSKYQFLRCWSDWV